MELTKIFVGKINFKIKLKLEKNQTKTNPDRWTHHQKTSKTKEKQFCIFIFYTYALCSLYHFTGNSFCDTWELERLSEDN